MINSKIIFMGTPQFAADVLAIMLPHTKISSVVTQPDKAQARSKKLVPCSVKCLAEKNQIPVFQPENKEGLVSYIKEESPDLVIVAAFGMILPAELLRVPIFGALNVHPSMLPKYRGPSPIEAAILAGDKKTGVTIMELSEKMDAGNIVAQKEFLLSGGETTPELQNKTAQMGGEMLIEVIPRWLNHELVSIPQVEDDATYTKLISKDDGKINFTFESAEKIERKCRAYTPWPGVYAYWEKKKLDFYEIKTINRELNPGHVELDAGDIAIGCISGAIKPKFFKMEGKNKVTASEFLCGYPNFIKSRLN
jgi:methionyl-tRNA formyltransferase